MAAFGQGPGQRAALAVLDEAGVDGLTVRAVAAKLDVKAAALYWHVRDKQELMDEMATEIWRGVSTEVATLPPGLPWDQTMATFAGITRRALLAHRDGAKVFSGTYLTDPAVLAGQEAGIEALTEQGFSVADVMRAFALLYSFVIGFCTEEQAVQQTPDDRYDPARRADRLAGRDAPRAAEASWEIFGHPDQRFADLVGVIIDAAGRMRAGRGA